MPQVDVLFYQESDGTVPLFLWLAGLETAAEIRCWQRIELLEEYGHELRRPHCENLGSGIYELRVRFHRIQYRMLYFFHERDTAVISHGFSKEGKIPQKEIHRALRHREQFQGDPEAHTFRPES